MVVTTSLPSVSVEITIQHCLSVTSCVMIVFCIWSIGAPCFSISAIISYWAKVCSRSLMQSQNLTLTIDAFLWWSFTTFLDFLRSVRSTKISQPFAQPIITYSVLRGCTSKHVIAFPRNSLSSSKNFPHSFQLSFSNAHRTPAEVPNRINSSVTAQHVARLSCFARSCVISDEMDCNNRGPPSTLQVVIFSLLVAFLSFWARSITYVLFSTSFFSAYLIKRCSFLLINLKISYLTVINESVSWFLILP